MPQSYKCIRGHLQSGRMANEWVAKGVAKGVAYVVYNKNHYFGLGPIPKTKPKLRDTFGRYHN